MKDLGLDGKENGLPAAAAGKVNGVNGVNGGTNSITA